MKTIEERAREFADRHEEAELNLRGLGGVYGYNRIKNAEICAYERGAEEQRKIDIDKAKKAFNEACGWLNSYPWYQEVLDQFIESMEK